MTKEKKEEKSIKVVIDGKEFEAKFREFKTGKKGYGVYGIVKIDNYPYRLCMNLIEVS